jgi:hypothetical protein
MSGYLIVCLNSNQYAKTQMGITTIYHLLFNCLSAVRFQQWNYLKMKELDTNLISSFQETETCFQDGIKRHEE